MKAPFPYFGGKRRVAALVWERLGDVDNYVEPFCGSAANLLNRPHPPRVETINDADCYVANFWRAIAADPEAVAECADWPVNECDMHARHRWLVLSQDAASFRQRMRRDPFYFDARFAGWWCWGLCCWIGGGWCTAHGETADGDRKQTLPLIGQDGKGVTCKPTPTGAEGLTGERLTAVEARRPGLAGERGVGHGVTCNPPRTFLHEKMPNCDSRGDAARGSVTAALSEQIPELGSCRGDAAAGKANLPPLPEQMPKLSSCDGVAVAGSATAGGRPQLGDAYARGRGVHGNDHAETCAHRRAWLTAWMSRLCDRLRTVRVCCGDWLRVCDSESVTVRLGTTGVFLDPPYSTEAKRDMGLYAVESGDVAHRVRTYCLERGGDRRMRIALCGYEGEGHEELERSGWSVVAWKAQGGYGNRGKHGKEGQGNANAGRERIWFSPHCLKPAAGLFGE